MARARSGGEADCCAMGARPVEATRDTCPGADISQALASYPEPGLHNEHPFAIL